MSYAQHEFLALNTYLSSFMKKSDAKIFIKSISRFHYKSPLLLHYSNDILATIFLPSFMYYSQNIQNNQEYL